MNGQLKVDFASGAPAKQSQLLLHGISPQPAHLYQLASPIPFTAGSFPSTAINTQKMNPQMAGMLMKGVPTSIQSHVGGVTTQSIQPAGVYGVTEINPKPSQVQNAQKGRGIEKSQHAQGATQGNQVQHRKMGTSLHPPGTISSSKNGAVL